MDGGNIGIFIFKPARGGGSGGSFGRRGLEKFVLLVVLGGGGWRKEPFTLERLRNDFNEVFAVQPARVGFALR